MSFGRQCGYSYHIDSKSSVLVAIQSLCLFNSRLICHDPLWTQHGMDAFWCPPFLSWNEETSPGGIWMSSERYFQLRQRALLAISQGLCDVCKNLSGNNSPSEARQPPGEREQGQHCRRKMSTTHWPLQILKPSSGHLGFQPFWDGVVQHCTKRSYFGPGWQFHA